MVCVGRSCADSENAHNKLIIKPEKSNILFISSYFMMLAAQNNNFFLFFILHFSFFIVFGRAASRTFGALASGYPRFASLIPAPPLCVGLVRGKPRRYYPSRFRPLCGRVSVRFAHLW
jgi:hypothetical protein